MGAAKHAHIKVDFCGQLHSKKAEGIRLSDTNEWMREWNHRWNYPWNFVCMIVGVIVSAKRKPEDRFYVHESGLY